MVVLILLVAAYALLAGVVLPAILQQQLPGLIRTAVDRPADVAEVRFDPFSLALSVRGLSLREADDTPVVEVAELFVDLDPASAWHLGVLLDEVRVDGLRVHAKVDREGVLNLLQLAPANEPNAPVAAEEEASEMPVVRLAKFALRDARIAFVDESGKQPFDFEVGPLAIQLESLSTELDAESSYSIAATAPTGEELSWSGSLTLAPLRSAGRVELQNIGLQKIWRYVRGELPLELAVGDADIAADYDLHREAEALVVRVDGGQVRVRDLQVGERGAAGHLARLGTFDVDGIEVDLVEETVRVEKVHLKSGELSVELEADGSSNLGRLAGPADEDAPAAPTEPSPWSVEIASIHLDTYAVSIADRTAQPESLLRVEPLDLRLGGVSNDLAKPIAIQAEAAVAGEGGISLDLESRLEPLSVKGTVVVTDLPISTFESYVQRFARVMVPSGRLGARGEIEVAATASGASDVRYGGTLDVGELRVSGVDPGPDLVGWKSLGVRGIDLDTAAASLNIEHVEIAGPVVNISYDEGGSLNLAGVAMPASGDDAVEEAAAEEESVDPVASEEMQVRIANLSIADGSIGFDDRSVRPRFRSLVHDLTGTVADLHINDPGGIRLNLQAMIDDDAPLEIAGAVSPPGHAKPTDVTVSLAGYDMSALTPYVAPYTGYAIDRGKLSLDLKYHIDESRLDGKNDVVADRLNLGERMESPTATTLPVGLALAMLKDRKGRITLDLPVRGDLDDPSFSFGGKLLDVFRNLLEKVITSPFSLLASVAGIGADEMSTVTFRPGSAELPADQVETIEAIAKVLSDRPGLKLEIRGAADEEADARGLARATLEAELYERWLEKAGMPPGMAGLGSVKLEPEARAGLVFDRYAEVFGAAVDEIEGEDEAARLARAEAALAERIEVDPEQVVELGRRRSRVIRDAIEARGVPIEQLFRVKSKVVTGHAGEVPVELTLTTSG